MRLLFGLRGRLRALFGRTSADRDLREEIRLHIDLETAKNIRLGMSAGEARRVALAHFGGVQRTREEHRDVRRSQAGLQWVEDLIANVRLALRGLCRQPGFTTAVVLTLALGIGANLAIFSVVSAVLLRPLPFPQPDRIVRLFDDLPGAGARDVGMSVPELADIEAQSHAFSAVSVIFPNSTALSGGDRVERVELMATSPGYFQLLGATAALGRAYGQADWVPGIADGVVISDALWQRQFGGDPHIIGRHIRVDEDPYTIIGVMPPGFRHPGNTLGADVDLWAAVGFTGDPFPSPPQRDRRFLPGAIARLAPGVSLAEAQRRVDALTTHLTQAYPDNYPARVRWTVRIEPAQQALTGNVRPILAILLAAVGLVLLIVCVNVSSVLLARASGRTREFAIRRALGASARRMVGQLLTESVLLALLSGIVAIIVVRVGQARLLALMPPDIPRLSEVHVDWRLVGVAIGLSLACGIVCGLAPALNAARHDPASGLRDGGRSTVGAGRHQARVRSALVAAEIALSVVLLVGTGLLVRSFAGVLLQDPGVRPDGLVIGQVWVPFPDHPEANHYRTPDQRIALDRRVDDVLRELPGVEAAAVASANEIPFLDVTSKPQLFSLPDEPTTTAADHAAQFGGVSARYFEVLGAGLASGRAFTDHDDAKAPSVVIVNQAFVRRFIPSGRPLGMRLRDGKGKDATIVGVALDVRHAGLDAEAEPQVYASILQSPTDKIGVMLRTRADAKTAEEAITSAIRAVDPELPVFGVRTMRDVMSTSIARRRFLLELITAFALAALSLAALGVYSVVSFMVVQRRPEFGVRIALGAESGNIVRLVAWPALRVVVVGAGIGILTAFAAVHVLADLLFGVSAGDPVSFLGAATTMAMVAIVACVAPLRRAIRTSPLEALRG